MNKMGDKNIKKEKKQKKASDTKTVVSPSTYIRPVVTQPELIKKVKKVK